MHNSTNERTVFVNRTFDQERALYGQRGLTLDHVTFAGPADGESAIKECRDVRISNTLFELRYPLWHVDQLEMDTSTMTDSCRAALWYTSNARISQSKLLGIKALRECENVVIDHSTVVSPEFGWMCRNVTLSDTLLEAEYVFMHSRDLTLTNCTLKGKYSFQYVENLVIEGGTFDTKDAFWHARNVTVRNATIKGEYLGWYSDGLTLEHCRIEGTQPFVNCRNLRVIDCEMIGCDLAFEGSDVQATIRGHVDSIRDPRSGRIEVGSVGELVHDTVAGCGATIVVKQTAQQTDRRPCACCC